MEILSVILAHVMLYLDFQCNIILEEFDENTYAKFAVNHVPVGPFLYGVARYRKVPYEKICQTLFLCEVFLISKNFNNFINCSLT